MKTQSMLKTTLVALAASTIALAAPGSAAAQMSGADVWARECGRCHRIQPPTRFDARHWEAIVGHMALTARLTSDEEDAVLEFLMGAARRIAAAQPEKGPLEVARLASLDLAVALAGLPDGRDVFIRQCVACHGESGKGDGPAAIAFDPKPANLTDSSRMGALTDDQLLEVLRNGKGPMPAFGKLLSDEDILAVLEYVRALSSKP